jgi:hypothetical protein
MTSLGDDAAPPSSVLLKARPGDDVRRDGLARELREDERRGVHRGVIVPQGRELRTFCGAVFLRRRGIVFGGSRGENASVICPFFDRRVHLSSPAARPARASSEAFAKIKLVREDRRIFSNFIDILVRHRTWWGAGFGGGGRAEREASILAGRRRGKRKPTAASGSLARRLALRGQTRERAFSGWFAFWDSLFGVERFTHPAPGAGPCWAA